MEKPFPLTSGAKKQILKITLQTVNYYVIILFKIVVQKYL